MSEAGSGGKEPTDWGPYGRKPVLVLAAVAFIDNVDQNILPGVLTEVQDDLGFSDLQAGALRTVFILTAFLALLPAGYLADRYRRTRIIAVVMLSWGAISALNSLVRNFGQFAAVRAALGAGETIDNPSSQSLLADYYRPSIRGRAYAIQRLAPLLGTAVGIGLGGVVGAVFGWRWAFLAVGVPGSVLALVVWRLPEPARGGSDRADIDEEAGDAAEPSSDPPTREIVREEGVRAALADVREALRIRTLRALMVGAAISVGATAGLGFWAPAFFARHTELGSGQAAVVVALLLVVGVVTGTWLGGVLSDRWRERYEGAPMVLAGTGQAICAALLMVAFSPIPTWIRIVLLLPAVMGMVAGIPALTAMISEVVPARIRGIGFSMTQFAGSLVAAASPLVVGFIADQFEIVVDGEVKGNLAYAFLIITPMIFVAAAVVLFGRRYVAEDMRRAAAAAELS